MEKLTQDLIETHMMSFIDIHSEEQNDGVTRFAWALNEMSEPERGREIKDREWSFQYKSFEAARDYAFGWIRRNAPHLVAAAKQEALDGIKYRASKAN